MATTLYSMECERKCDSKASSDQDSTCALDEADTVRRESKGSSTESQESSIPAEQQHHSSHDPAVTEKQSLHLDPSSRPSVNHASLIPDGGLIAWLQVLGSFFLFFNTWGVFNTFGSYQTYYETGILASSSPSDIAWVGSIQATLLMGIGLFAGPIYDAGHVQALLYVGSFLTVLGQMMLSLCQSYWQVVLAQGVCIGLGAGILFIPSLAILSQYFHRRYATAVGIGAAGSSIGGVIYPIVFYKLQPTIGFAWATRVIGFIMLGTLGICLATIRARDKPGARRKMLDLTAFREAPYVLFVIALFFAFTGLYTPFFYVQSYAIDTHLANPDLGFYLLPIMNAASSFGRVIPNIVADRVGPLNIITPCGLISGVLCLCYIATRSVTGVIVICVLYGFTSGTFVSLPGSVLVRLTKDRAVIGTRMGMCFTIASVGLLVGQPINGVIISRTGGSFTYVWVFGGVLTIVATGFMVAARVAVRGWTLKAII